jgi:hypothetical protein
MTQKTIASFALGLPLMLGMAANLLAQSSGGTIHGQVLDPSGALVAGAEIRITDENGFARTLKSGARGSFEVPHLAPGSYSVSINATGFTPALEGGISVVGDRVTEESIKLGISVTSEIDVTADDDGK